MPPPTSTFISSIEISINGVTITRANYLRINQRFETHHNFEISVSPEMLVGQENTLQNIANQFIGKGATIRLTQTRPGATAQNLVFYGGVTSVRLIKGQSRTSTYLISGVSPTIPLSAGIRTRSFENQTLADIVNSCYSSPGLRVSPNFIAPIPYVTQYQEDKFQFLQRLASRYGEWFYYDGENIIFGKPARPSAPTIDLASGTNLFEMEYSLRVIPLKFKPSYFNHEAFDRFDANSANIQVSGLSSLAQLAADRSDIVFADDTLNTIHLQNFEALPDLEEATRLEKAVRTNKLALLTGVSPEMELKIGNLIHVTDPAYTNGELTNTVDYGTFVVVSLYHSLDSSGIYQVRFEAVSQDADFPPVTYLVAQPQATPQLAVVKDTADPLELGRVKVEFMWQGSGIATSPGTTPWIRVSSAMTSHSKSYFIPEVDDTVMVDFEYGNPDLPYVAGSLYANDNGPRKPGAELFRPDNHIKGIITRGGNHIIIDDEDGKEKILIFNKENKNKIELSLDGEPQINIHSEGEINMTAKNINIKASEELKMEGKNLVQIESDTLIDAKSQDEIKIYGVSKAGIGSDDKCLSSGARVGITATSEMKIESATMELAANATMDLKASASLAIDGGAMAALKGVMVMIN